MFWYDSPKKSYPLEKINIFSELVVTLRDLSSKKRRRPRSRCRWIPRKDPFIRHPTLCLFGLADFPLTRARMLMGIFALPFLLCDWSFLERREGFCFFRTR